MTTPDPGWYPDSAGVTRYWTGTQWGPAQPASGTSEFVDTSRPLPKRNLADIAVKPGKGNVAMGLIAVVCGFPVYIVAAFVGAMAAGQAGIVVALIIAALLCYCAGWGIAQNRREELAARDAQIKLGRHLTNKEDQ